MDYKHIKNDDEMKMNQHIGSSYNLPNLYVFVPTTLFTRMSLLNTSSKLIHQTGKGGAEGKGALYLIMFYLQLSVIILDPNLA